MVYKQYVFSVILRILVLLGTLIALAFGIVHGHLYLIMIGSISSIIAVYSLYRYVVRRFISIDDFFESVKYRDFSRWFSEDKAPRDLRDLHKGFNLVNGTIKSINNERQAQFLYLQKILEMVDVGIIAYNVETGEVLWTNDSFLQTLDFPSFKNINFVSSRKPEVYDTLFETYHPTTTSVTLEMNQETFKVLVTDSVFHVEEHSFKLVVLQNIEETLNQNESDAWKKLLSVMTHEIMNSIAPISSLAETLQVHIQSSMSTPDTAIDLDDLVSGITSIKKRSEGLMKFAQTYRTLNTITHVNRSKVNAQELFKSIEDLMQPTLLQKGGTLTFMLDDTVLFLEIDTYLIEQVLINLILNAIDATQGVPNPKIVISAIKNTKGNAQIIVRDNGSGIPDEILDSIFIPFFSTKKTGSGIGLSLCKQIMTLHQGKIQLRNLENSGTEARLIF